MFLWNLAADHFSAKLFSNNDSILNRLMCSFQKEINKIITEIPLYYKEYLFTIRQLSVLSGKIK